MTYCLRRGEIHGIAGESGCGKTSAALSLLGLLPTAVVSGKLLLPPNERYDLADQGPESSTLARLRGRRIALTFQEPTAALDPLRRVGDQVAEVARTRRGRGRAARRLARDDARRTLEAVDLTDLERTSRLYPHEMSGGMRQRAALALALAARPDVLIADEPTTALDGLLQARVLETFRRVARDSVGALEIISHDLAVLASTADRIAILYAGRLVEEGLSRDLVQRPAHPYTRGLLAAVPALGRQAERPRAIPAGPHETSGCAFAPRCGERLDLCDAREPELVEREPGRRVACWRAAGER